MTYNNTFYYQIICLGRNSLTGDTKSRFIQVITSSIGNPFLFPFLFLFPFCVQDISSNNNNKTIKPDIFCNVISLQDIDVMKDW